MVASTHWLASVAGMAMLERGGNAFDAAVAAGFVLQVVEPHLNGPGGEVPILLYSADAPPTSSARQPSTALRAAATALARTRIWSAVSASMRGTGTVVSARPAAYSASVASSAAYVSLSTRSARISGWRRTR